MNLPSARHAGPRFKPGRIFTTPAALEVIAGARVSIIDLLIRHMRGDWGRLTDEDWQRNERVLQTGDYLLSSYILSNSQKIWMHTICERSATFVLLPAEEFRLEPSLRDALLGR
ncbi:hypothetical protein K6Y74_36950 [Burkholderia cenocepacia]|uniref:hypothetical protein n=1 Tax=Burkholderia cepacia complex TaxID=87882 RepID=UPI001C264FEE|nr:hypothetical protein [Burkholderia cenocepacia]MBU9550490.1 hypothetical protein [Burkholderia multivorans]MCW3648856.1 hypothetical protein [Burkholderia cenocepacia]MEB2540430.1 hypothetical protein [Burkholderia cenocepacia]